MLFYFNMILLKLKQLPQCHELHRKPQKYSPDILDIFRKTQKVNPKFLPQPQLRDIVMDENDFKQHRFVFKVADLILENVGKHGILTFDFVIFIGGNR